MIKRFLSPVVRLLSLSAVVLLCLALILGLWTPGASAQSGPPKIWLAESQRLAVNYSGPGSSAATDVGAAQPVSMVQGDFDQDGVTDLAVGFSAAGGSFIAIHRGNLDAFAPQSDASFQAIGRGQFPSPFLPEARTFAVPIRPDFIAAGDFTGQGNTDLAVASRGGSAIYIFAGDGKGNFTAGQTINLPGGVTSLGAGFLGESQPFVDLIIGVSGPKPFLVIYAGGPKGLSPLSAFPLKSPAKSINFGDFGDVGPDVAFLSGGQVVLLHSSTLQLETLSLPVNAQALALGSFVSDRMPGLQIAILDSNGSVQIAAHNEFDPRSFTLDELKTIRQARIKGLPNPFVPDMFVAKNGWRIVESIPSVTSYSASQAPVFFRTRISSNAPDDLMVLNGLTGQMSVVSHPDVQPGATNFIAAQVSTRPYIGSPVAAISARVNIDGRPGVLAIHAGETGPRVMSPLPDPTFTVNRTDDPAPPADLTTVCNGMANDCSLREAILKANSIAGTDTINVPAGTYTLTLPRVAGDFTGQHGTLEVTDSVNIIGATDGGGNPTSIIQAGTTTANEVDKVFSFNQDIAAFTTATVSISNLVIQNGFNRGDSTVRQDGFGGAFDFDTGGTNAMTATATLTVTNCIIQNSQTTDGLGGGVATFNTNGGTGTASFTNSTIQGNKVILASGGAGNGGGWFIAQPSTATLTNVQVLNNLANQTAGMSKGQGGGLWIVGSAAHTRTTIHGGSFSGNTAAGDGGGIYSTAGITIDPGAANPVISNNSAGGDGGGLWYNAINETATLSKVTITGNSATGGSIGGGGGILESSGTGVVLNISASRIAGNSAPAGKNFFFQGGNASSKAANNWWGTNTPSSTINVVSNCPNGTGQICFDPFVVLTHTASPNKIRINQSSALTADITRDNHGALSPNIDVLLNLPINFHNAVLGGIANDQTSIQPTTVSAPIATSPTGATESGSTVTITTTSPHGLVTGQAVVVSGVGVGGYNGTFVVTGTPTTTTFTYTDSATALADSGNGTAASAVIGQALATYNAGTGGGQGSADATVDQQTTTANIVVLQPPTMTKAFSPTTVKVGASSTITFTVKNDVNVVAINASFADTLPANLVVANPTNASNTCGGTFAPSPGDTSLSFSNNSLAALTTCTIKVDVKGTTDGVYHNSVQILSSDAGDGNTAATSPDLTVINPPGINKVFGQAVIPLNGTASLTFTVTNPNSNLALTGISFTDTLPTASPVGTLVVATPNGAGGTCLSVAGPVTSAGTLTAVAGSSTVSLAGLAMNAGGSCTVTVNVTGTLGGQADNSVTASDTLAGAGTPSTASITVVAPPTISKAFSPSGSIALNVVITTVTFGISNPNLTAAGDLTGVGFTDTLPSATGTLAVAPTPNVSTTCGGGTGIVTATPGSGVITVAGGSVAHNTTCTISVDVKGTAAGDANNTTGAITSNEGGTGTTSNTAALTVVAPPSIAKAFGAASIPLNGVTTLTFTITNPAANTVAEAGVAFSDTLPAGLVVATPNNLTNNCGGTATAAPGGTSINLTGGSIAVNNSCTVVVNVTGTASGQYTNTSGAVTSTNGGTGNTASANLTVANPPQITKQFTLHQIPLNGTTTVTFGIQNPNTNVALTGIAFTDTLPAGLQVAPIPNASNTCGGTFAPVAAATSVSLSGGTLAASASCTVTVDVQGTTAGVKNNSVQATSTEGGPGSPSTDSITVVGPPSISKSFGANSIAVNASTSLSFTIQNNNGTTTLTGIGFTDTLPAGLIISIPNGQSGSCGGGTITATQGTNVISLSGATLTPSSSCTFSVNVTAVDTGTQSNVTGNVTSTEGGTGNTANASINVTVAPPTIGKAFSSNAVGLGATLGLTFTIVNPNPSNTLTGISFTDNLPSGLVVATPNNLSSDCGGTVTATAGSTSISLTGGAIDPGPPPPIARPHGAAAPRRGAVTRKAGAVTNANAQGFCSINVSLLANTLGTKTNTTGPVSANESGPGGTGTATVDVIQAPTIAKAFGAASIPLNGTTSLTFTFANPSAGTTFVGTAVNDTLPAGLVVASPANLGGSCLVDPFGVDVTATPGSNSITTANLSLNPGASCTLSVDVSGTTGGHKANISGHVTATFDDGFGGFIPITGNTATASIDVVAPPVIAKSFNPAAIAPGGVSTLTFTITNPAVNTVAELNVSFTDALPAELLVAMPNGAVGNCNGGTLFADPGTNSISLFGSGTIPASGSCVVSVNVASTGAPGTFINTTGAVNSVNGGNGNHASATIKVANASLSITKTHQGTFQRGQNGAQYFLKVSNDANAGPTVGTVTVVDTLPANANPHNLVPVSLAGTGWTCTLATLTCTRSDVLAPGASYPVITFTVNIPQNIINSFTNQATVSGGGDPNSHTASDHVTLGPPILITSTDSGAQTVKGGNPATFNFMVDASAINPPPTTVAFKCTSLPAGTACIFTPLGEAQIIQAPLTLMVTTLGHSSALPPPFGRGLPPVYAALLITLLGLAGVSLSRSKGRKLRLRLALGFAALMLLLLALAGCGGNGFANVTPPGTYTITVTGTANTAQGTVQGSTTVSLTVQ